MPTMPPPERSKVTFDVSEPTRRALAIFAAERNVTIGDVIERLVKLHLPDHLARAIEAIENGEEAPKPRRGRKPKGD